MSGGLNSYPLEEKKMMDNLSQRAARALVKSLQRGTIRPGGAKFLHRGHENWIGAQVEELKEIEVDGGAVVHFVRGAYGEGKTHFLYYLEELARGQGWATAHLECRRDNVELDRFETIYPSIIQKLRLFPDVLDNEEEGTEDPTRKLLDLWAKGLLEEVGYVRQGVVRPFEAEMKLFELLQERVMLRNLPGDLQTVLCAYPRAVLQGDSTAQVDLIAWMKAEDRKIHVPLSLLSMPGQRVNAPGVNPRLVGAVTIRPISSATSLSIFRGIVWLLSRCGFKGLILAIDEVEQIARLRPAIRLERALQTLREFVDNTDGDVGFQRVAIYFAATPNIFDDEKYFRSYDALATRIEPVSDEVNWRAPVINLEMTMLTRDDLQWVASRIRWVYDRAYGTEATSGITDVHLSEIVTAVDNSRYRIAKPRLLCRLVVDQLDRARQGQALKNTEQLLPQTAVHLLQEQEQ
jgi:hypothetical protein